MGDEPSMVDELRRQLERDPENTTVRLRLASILLDEDPTEALSQVQHVLARDPADEAALRVAADAAAAAGRADLAESYHRLAVALGAAEVAPVPTEPGTPVPVAVDRDDVGDAGADEFDAFLRELVEEDVRHRITLDDVGGLDDVKRRLQTSFLGPMRNPALRQAFGTSLRGGLLLYGPPGCGKTFLARAVAGELGAHFLSIGLHDVLDMWMGNSEKKLHAIFERARARRPSVLFLDEVDAIGQKRSHLARSAGRNIVVQLLTELDSLADDNDGLFVLGATNAPWDLDAALRRPGRFDHSLLVLPPDERARRAILAYHLRDKPVDGEVDLAGLAARTEGFSGADLRLVTESAAQAALGESIEAGAVRTITAAHLATAAGEVRPSTTAWFHNARNFVLFANEAGDYDDLLAWMRDHGHA